jgi:hypothetical protein
MQMKDFKTLLAVLTSMLALCCRYDAAHDLGASKDGMGKHADVEEDEFQKKVGKMLQAKHVDAEDKSIKAYLTRFR